MATQTMRLLIVEDEPAIRDMIRFALPKAEFNCVMAENTDQALQVLHEQAIDLMLLDWMLPDRSGIEFIRHLRASELWRDLPIIMLTARAEEENKVRGLEIGADDYVTKPFSPTELAARIRTVLRRGAIVTNGAVAFKDLMINTQKHTVSIADQVLILTPIEYRLLNFFIAHQHKVYSREQLIILVWGGSADIEDRAVDAQIKRLRKKLQPFGYDEFLKTIRGSGYILTDH